MTLVSVTCAYYYTRAMLSYFAVSAFRHLFSMSYFNYFSALSRRGERGNTGRKFSRSIGKSSSNIPIELVSLDCKNCLKGLKGGEFGFGEYGYEPVLTCIFFTLLDGLPCIYLWSSICDDIEFSTTCSKF